MTSFKYTLQTINEWLRTLIDFGLSLLLVFIIIDILFPGTTGVIENVGEIVSGFAEHGVVGLIALLIFLLIYRK